MRLNNYLEQNESLAVVEYTLLFNMAYLKGLNYLHTSQGLTISVYILAAITTTISLVLQHPTSLDTSNSGHALLVKAATASCMILPVSRTMGGLTRLK